MVKGNKEVSNKEMGLFNRGINLQLFAEGGDTGGDAGGDTGNQGQGQGQGNTGDIAELLGDELYSQVKSKLGDDHEVVIANNGQWIPKGKFDSINNEAKQYKDQIQSLNETIKELQGKAGDNTELTGKLQEMQDQIKAKEDEMAKTKLGYSIQMAAMKANPHDVKDLMALINIDDYKIQEDGKIVNVKEAKALDDVIGELKETKAYLFKDQGPQGTGGSKGAGKKKTDPLDDPFLKGFMKG